jgi:hypothetical protein
MSGYPRDFDEDDTGRTAFIQKPFAMADLTRAVDELLAAASVTTA